MAEHPNAAVVRRLSEAFVSGDMAVVAAVGDEVMADDVVWHEIGRAEPRRGKAELRAGMGEIDYTITAETHDILANDDHVVAPGGRDRDARRQDAPLPGRRDLPRPERQDHRAVGLLRRHRRHHRVLRLTVQCDGEQRKTRPRAQAPHDHQRERPLAHVGSGPCRDRPWPSQAAAVSEFSRLEAAASRRGRRR